MFFGGWVSSERRSIGNEGARVFALQSAQLRHRAAREALVNVRRLQISDSEYPRRLLDLSSPPPVLYVRGALPSPLAPIVAIVGTRHPTREAESFAAHLASELVHSGVNVCSGGAEGIDTAAHRGCADAGNPTWVIAPSSIDCPYPEENAALFDRIVATGGGILSAYEPGLPARLPHFFERNSVLAALASVVVVVETALRGGARNAASAARKLGRKVLAVPGAPWNPRASGCLVEIRNGASLAVTSADILRALGRTPPCARRGSDRPARPGKTTARKASCRRPSTDLDQEGHLFVSAIESGARHLDAVCSVTGLPIARAQALLLTLTLEGIVVSDPSGRVSLVTQ